MSLTVANLNARLVADTSKFVQEMNAAETKAVGAFHRIGAAAEKLKSVGRRLSLFVTAPIVALGVKVFKAASDLTESLNAAEVAFGDQADVVKDWAEDLDSAFGFTQRGALDAAAGFKLVAKDADLSAEDFVALAERASDLGSVFNVETTEAARALRSALVGEMEPIRRLGVVMNQASIEARALALGLVDEGQELDFAGRQAAIFNIIMEQTSGAQGDAVKTADEAAGQMRVLRAEMGRAAEDIGQKLIPIGVKLLGKLRSMVEWFSNLSSGTQDTIIQVVALAAAVGPVLFIVGQLITVIRGLSVAMLFLAANPVVLIIAVIVALGVALFMAWRKSQTFRDVVMGVFEAVVNFVGDAVGFFLQFIAGMVGGLASVLEAAENIPFIGDKFSGMADAVRSAEQSITDSANRMHEGINLVNNDGERLIQTFQDLKNEGMSTQEAVANIGIAGLLSARAHGGPVQAGRAFLVGERGPELFVPNVSGQVVANNDIRAGGGGTTVVVNVGGSVIAERDLGNTLQQVLLDFQRRGGRITGN